MDFELLNKIIKDGECLDTCEIGDDIYYKILYDNTIYVISENKTGVKIVQEGRKIKNEFKKRSVKSIT